MPNRKKSFVAHAVRFGALAAVVVMVPALAQKDDDNTRAVRVLEEPLVPPPEPAAVPAPGGPTAAPTTNALPPLVTPPPATTSALPPLIAPPPLAAPTPQFTPPPAVVSAPQPAPPPSAPAPRAAAPQSAPSTFQVMSLPAVEVKVPPTPAEIGMLNSSVKVANPLGVALDILPGADITVGSQVSFRISTKKEGYLILVDVDASGKLTQIYPNPASRGALRQNSNYVRPGRAVQIPNPTDVFAGFEFRAAEPVGTAMVVAILSDRPVQTIDLPDIPPSMTGRTDALAFLTKFASDLRIPGEGGSRMQLARWSFDAKFYAIR
jgi:hypothetical protein